MSLTPEERGILEKIRRDYSMFNRERLNVPSLIYQDVHFMLDIIDRLTREIEEMKGKKP
jgi:hypothetical protein